MNFIGLLAAALIVCFLAFVSLKSYFKGPEPQMSNQLKEAAGEQNIDTSSYQSVLGDVKSQLNIATQKETDRIRQLEGTEQEKGEGR